MTNQTSAEYQAVLERIAVALERLAPAAAKAPDLAASPCWKWDGPAAGLRPLGAVPVVPLAQLHGIDAQKQTLIANTRRFASGRPANNVLLWGARGMGKSALVKAVHAHCVEAGDLLVLIEIDRDDLASLPQLLRLLGSTAHRTIIYCDDLAFEQADAHYKALKTVLEGSLEARPESVLFYATSNRRHIIARSAVENEVDSSLHPRDAVDDKVALADRFGLWLGFHPCDQETYVAMVTGYAAAFGMALEGLVPAALEWSITRGSRSGRVAWQFIQSRR